MMLGENNQGWHNKGRKTKICSLKGTWTIARHRNKEKKMQDNIDSPAPPIFGCCCFFFPH